MRRQGEENDRLQRMNADLIQTQAQLVTCESRLSILEAAAARDQARDHELLVARRQLREDRMRVEDAIVQELGRVALSYKTACEEKDEEAAGSRGGPWRRSSSTDIPPL